ncbi:alpha/beta hydrolase family protein [Haliangium ochraceum]|uniref:AB hydrolase-1 domain-containing protein n=1 Tax=Haliangium ochraceum (strain DSM 14365 / JCM 11303 / SMP-2) TaxID=502025 RepID=D0LID8_HALO1|nr:alpha/beta fold hydrolase [Haliangium ochraceum]ACY18294.1 conserved hypothetical protein [Haliangium ochraceum DSM 14365]
MSTESMNTIACSALALRDPVQDVRIPVWLVYPCDGPAPPEPMRFGPYALDAVADAPMRGERVPLVLLSHGNGGSPWTHHGLIAHLARAGFAVALVEHIGNSRSDNSLAGTAEILAHRPRHLRQVLDTLAEHPRLGAQLALERVAVIGHSIGAYTALAAAGGRPRSFAHEERERQEREVEVSADPRVAALVLLAPATVWLRMPGALSAVTQPIFMRSGERDEITGGVHAEIVLRGVPEPARVDHEVVANAGHFSFQSVFPALLQRPGFPPAHDPEGFDRAAYEPALAAEIIAFLRASLPAA